jgi:gliding motility-associated-like protein
MKNSLILIFIFLSFGIFAQTTPTSIYPESQTVPCNTLVEVPIKASRFRSMLSMQGTITWDTAALRFDSIADFGPSALALLASNFGQTQTASGRLFFSWNDPALKGVTLPDSSSLFRLRFTILATSATTTSVSVGGTIVPLELLDSNYVAIPSVGGTGQVSLPFVIPGYNPFPDTTRVCGPSITLDAGAGYAQYTWSNGNVGRTALIAANGIYTVSVRNALGCTAQDLTRVSLVTADILQSDTTVCRGARLSLSARTGTGWQFSWTPSGTGPSLTVSPLQSTTYRLTVTDGITRCSDSIVVTLSPVDTTLTVSGPETFCRSRDSIVLRAAPAVGYRWLRNGSLLAADTSASLRPDSSGSYRAVLRNALGCIDTTRSVSVTVNPLPLTRLLSVGDSLLCEGGTRLLTASGGTSYRWYRNDTLVGGIVRDSLQVTTPGQYSVEAVSAAGCVKRADTTVAFTLLRRASLAFDVTGVCVDVPIRFTNRSTAPSLGTVAWRWSFGNGDTSRLFSDSVIYRTPGSYRATLRYTNARCPTHTDTLSRTLTLIRERSVRFADQVAVKGVPKTIFARDTASVWVWRPTAGLSTANVYNPTATLQAAQQYVIQSTLRNGCLVYDTLLVKVAANTAIHVPKAFSPNNDGQNDRLFPILVGISNLQYFRVYNRWGVLVYEARTYGTSIGWDGTYKGTPQPMETYIWVAEAVDVLGKTLKAGGNSILIR